MKGEKIVYWISTGLLCALMLYSAQMYLFNYEAVCGYFLTMGFPDWIVLPLAILKILAVIAILSKQSKMLKEWAYAGIAFDVILAFCTHISNDDGGYLFSLIGIILVIISYVMDRRLYSVYK